MERTTAGEAECLALSFHPVKPRNAHITVGPNNERGPGSILRGNSSQRLRAEAATANDPRYRILNPASRMRFEVRPSGSELDTPLTDPCFVNVAVQQTFTLHVALFHNGEPIPPGFEMIP